MPEPSQYLTATEVGDILRLSPISVLRLCREGKIPATKPAGTWLIHRDDLDAHLAASRNDNRAAS